MSIEPSNAPVVGLKLSINAVAEGEQGSDQRHCQLTISPDPKGVAAACPASMTRCFRREAAGLFLAFNSLVPKPSELADLLSGGVGFGRGLHAARRSRSVLNVPFQSSIRAWMLSHAARSARSSFSGESATRPSSSSCPMGP
jgi:hypothetical protein